MLPVNSQQFQIDSKLIEPLYQSNFPQTKTENIFWKHGILEWLFVMLCYLLFTYLIYKQKVLPLAPSVRVNFSIFFYFEGGTRCGKGEGIHILRLDDPQDLLRAFEAASSSRLESKRKSMYKCKS